MATEKECGFYQIITKTSLMVEIGPGEYEPRRIETTQHAALVSEVLFVLASRGEIEARLVASKRDLAKLPRFHWRDKMQGFLLVACPGETTKTFQVVRRFESDDEAL